MNKGQFINSIIKIGSNVAHLSVSIKDIERPSKKYLMEELDEAPNDNLHVYNEITITTSDKLKNFLNLKGFLENLSSNFFIKIIGISDPRMEDKMIINFHD